MAKPLHFLSGICALVLAAVIFVILMATDSKSVRAVSPAGDESSPTQRSPVPQSPAAVSEGNGEAEAGVDQEQISDLATTREYVRSGIYDDADDLEEGQYRIFLTEPYSTRPDADVVENWNQEVPVEITAKLEPGQSRRVVEGIKPFDVAEGVNPGRDSNVVTGADPYYLEPGQERRIIGPRPNYSSSPFNTDLK